MGTHDVTLQVVACNASGKAAVHDGHVYHMRRKAVSDGNNYESENQCAFWTYLWCSGVAVVEEGRIASATVSPS